MFKALLRKQFLEVGQTFMGKTRNGKKRKKVGAVGMGILMVLVFLMLAGVFYVMAASMAEPFVAMNLDWFYFMFMGLLAVLLGVIGSAFSTYSGLYQSKDNELLLAMPIPPSNILTVRLIGVFATSFIYEAIVLIPSVVAYYQVAPVGANLVFSILMVLVVAVFITVLSCFFGWIISLFAAKLKNKSYLTVLISLVLIGLYYYVYFTVIGDMQSFIGNAITMGQNIGNNVLFLYLFGNAFLGDLVAFFIMLVISLALMAFVCWLMAKNFIKSVTTNPGEKKKEYVRKDLKASSIKNAIFKKELKRFTSSATYMLNASLGTVIILLGCVAVLFKMNDIRAMIAELMVFTPGIVKDLAVMSTLAAVIGAATNDIVTPSISLEGKERWIYMTLPVDIKTVIQQKKKLHLVLTMPIAVLLALIAGIVIELPIAALVVSVVSTVILVYMLTDMDLWIGMFKPRYDWTNETRAIKQSAAIFIAMMGGWAITAVIGVLYFFVLRGINPLMYLGIVDVIAIVVTVLLELSINKKAPTVFMK